jgi:hypothetical protein
MATSKFGGTPSNVPFNAAAQGTPTIPYVVSDRGKLSTALALAANTVERFNVAQGAYRIVSPNMLAGEVLSVFISEWIGRTIAAGSISSGTGGVMRINEVAHGLAVGNPIYLQRLEWSVVAFRYGNGSYAVSAVIDADNFEVPFPFPVGGTLTGTLGNILHTSYAPVDSPMGPNDHVIMFLGPGPHEFFVRIGDGPDDVTGGFGGGPTNNIATYPLGFSQLCLRHNGAAARDIYVGLRA